MALLRQLLDLVVEEEVAQPWEAGVGAALLLVELGEQLERGRGAQGRQRTGYLGPALDIYISGTPCYACNTFW